MASVVLGEKQLNTLYLIIQYDNLFKDINNLIFQKKYRGRRLVSTYCKQFSNISVIDMKLGLKALILLAITLRERLNTQLKYNKNRNSRIEFLFLLNCTCHLIFRVFNKYIFSRIISTPEYRPNLHDY